MAYWRTLKNGERRLIYTAKDKRIQAERRVLHGFHFRKPFSFNRKDIKANARLCTLSIYPHSVNINQWMNDLLEEQAILYARIHNTLILQATGKIIEPLWLSFNPDDARAALVDIQEEIRMVREVGKEIGVNFYDQSDNSKRGN